MTRLLLLTAVLALPLMASLASLGPAQAHEYKTDTVTIDHPWSRGTPPGAQAAAVYMTLSAPVGADRLLSAATPAAERVELHTHQVQDGVVRMRPVTAIEVSEGENTVLEPGGLHVMLLGLTEPLVEGEAFPMTLTFERGGDVEVSVAVEAIGATAPHGHHGGHGDHGDGHGDGHSH